VLAIGVKAGEHCMRIRVLRISFQRLSRNQFSVGRPTNFEQQARQVTIGPSPLGRDFNYTSQRLLGSRVLTQFRLGERLDLEGVDILRCCGQDLGRNC